MLHKNNIFTMREARYRLLYGDYDSDVAWVLHLDRPKAWPARLSLRLVQSLGVKTVEVSTTSPGTVVDENGVVLNESGAAVAEELRSRKVTQKMSDVRDRSWTIIEDLVTKHVPAIYDPKLRGPLVLDAAKAHDSTPTTIYKCLRRYMRGGQTKSTLIGDFDLCGRSTDLKTGASRGSGAKKKNGENTFQIQAVDKEHFDTVIVNYYLKGKLKTIRKTYQRLLDTNYFYLDGNGKPYIKESDEWPSLRQFSYYLKEAYPAHARTRAREGDVDFERDHREVLGTVLQDCEGVGHQYEGDATIVDVSLVAAEKIQKIIGKPTAYLIIDRKSRLVVGWYVGLENPSWICAMLALLSISMDKAALCRRLGVEYDPEDWPAQEIFPKELLADNSELKTKQSDVLGSELNVVVTNVPAKRPDWKPVVECGFKQTREILQGDAPGFDPPENAMRRQGKKYDRDACMTLSAFEKVFLEAIIAHNRKPLLDYPLSLEEIGDEVNPIPIDLFNHGIVKRSGKLSTFDEATVRMALLQRAKASVSEQGICVENCYYASELVSSKGWFVDARQKRFKVDVAYDRRLVDTVYVFDPADPGRYYLCSLTPRSTMYKGLSFTEVRGIIHFQRAREPELEQRGLQVLSDYNRSANEVYASGRKRLKDAKLTSSRRSRRVDTKPAREDELRKSRQASASLPSPSTTTPAPLPSLSGVGLNATFSNADQQSASSTQCPPPPIHAPGSTASIADAAPALTALEKMRLKKAKTLNAKP